MRRGSSILDRIDFSSIQTLWYENEDGDKFNPYDSSGDIRTIPSGFKYQVSRFSDLRESILKIVSDLDVAECEHPDDFREVDHGLIDGYEGESCKKCGGYYSRKIGEPLTWSSGASVKVLECNMGWSDDLALALANRGISLKTAIIIAATSCERCMNSMADELGLGWGYPEYSREWQTSGTTCDFCKDVSDSGKVAGIKDVVTKIIHLVRPKEKAMDMAERVVDFWRGKDNKDLTPKEQRDLYGPVDYGSTKQMTRKKKLDIGWTDHAEYRSDLRDVDHRMVNESIVDKLRNTDKLRSRRPVKFKQPGVGTMVVDYDLTKNPAKADVVTVWANRIAGNLSVPENFDLHEEYDGFMIYSGGNDWEAYFRTVVVIPKRPLYESNSMVWIVIENPEGDDFDHFHDHGKKVYNKWKEEYRKAKNDGGRGLSAWVHAMRSEAVSGFIEDCGEAEFSWKEKKEKTGSLRRGRFAGVKFVERGDIESSLLEALRHCEDVADQV